MLKPIFFVILHAVVKVGTPLPLDKVLFAVKNKQTHYNESEEHH